MCVCTNRQRCVCVCVCVLIGRGVCVCVCVLIGRGVCVHTCSCLVAQSRLTLCNSMNRSPPGSSMGILQARFEPRSLALQADSLPSEPPGKP